MPVQDPPTTPEDAGAGVDAALRGADGAAAPLSHPTEIALNSVRELARDLVRHTPLILGALVVLVLTWILAAVARVVVRHVTDRTRMRTGLKDLLVTLANIGVWVVGILVAAVILFPGLTPARALGVLGLGSVAIGFAFKDIFENFFAGMLILWKFPFDPGDFIETEGGLAGKVESITVRMTLLRQTDGQLVTLPNALLFKEPVRVMTSRPLRRLSILCGVAYGEDVDASRKVIRKAVEACASVDADHDVQVFAREFADSSVNFEIAWWTGATPLDERRSRDQVVAAVKRALDEAGIEIPFPYRTLTFKEPLSLHRGAGAGDAGEPAADRPEGNSASS